MSQPQPARVPWWLTPTPDLNRELKRTEIALKRMPPHALAELDRLTQQPTVTAETEAVIALLRPYLEAVTDDEIDQALMQDAGN